MKKALFLTALLLTGCMDREPKQTIEIDPESGCPNRYVLDCSEEGYECLKAQKCWQDYINNQCVPEGCDIPSALTPEQEEYIQEWLTEHYPNTDFNNTLNP